MFKCTGFHSNIQLNVVSTCIKLKNVWILMCYYLKLLISHKVKVDPYHDEGSCSIIPSTESFLFGKFKADLKIPVMKGQA